MPTVRVEETLSVAREALFAVLTDHEGYSRFSGVAKCELLRGGAIGNRAAAQTARGFKAAVRKAAALAGDRQEA